MTSKPAEQMVGDPEIDAMFKCLMICINACQCPTCGARADIQCRSTSGRIVPHHATRTQAGHKLLCTPFDEIQQRAVKHFMGP